MLLWEDSPFELGSLAYVRENLQVRLVTKSTKGLAKEFVFNLLENRMTLDAPVGK